MVSEWSWVLLLHRRLTGPPSIKCSLRTEAGCTGNLDLSQVSAKRSCPCCSWRFAYACCFKAAANALEHDRENKPGVQSQASWLLQIHMIGSQQQDRDVVIAACAVPVLVGLLRSTQDDVQKRAACALVELARSQRDKDAIIAAGAVPPLVALVTSDQLAEQYEAQKPCGLCLTLNKARMPSLPQTLCLCW